MERYRYRPLRFYVTCFAVTWIFWILAAVISKSPNDNGISSLLMLAGLTAPAVIAIVVFIAAAVVVLTNREMFFEKEHIGNLLDYREERKI